MRFDSPTLGRLAVRGLLVVTLAVAAASVGESPGALATPAQTFDSTNTDWSLCFNTAPVAGSLACSDAGTAANPLSAGSAVTMYDVLNIQTGGRLAMPITYITGDWGYASATPESQVGDVTLQLDLKCDGIVDTVSGGNGSNDIGATGSEGPGQNWPNASVWKPYPFKNKGASPPTDPTAADYYVGKIKSSPPTFAQISFDRADLRTTWIANTAALSLPNMQADQAIPMNLLTEGHSRSAHRNEFGRYGHIGAM